MDWVDALQDLIGRDGETLSVAQMSVRAAIVFFYGLALLRVAHKRAFGRWSALDIIFSVVVGSNLSRALTGNAPFVPTLVATAVLMLLHGVLVSASARVPALGPLLKGKPARLIRDGEIDRHALHRHGVGQGDLDEALRSKSVEDPADVRAAYIERSGDISVLKR